MLPRTILMKSLVRMPRIELGRLVRLIALSAILCFVAPSRLQAQPHHDGGLWFAALGNGKIPGAEESPVRWWFDAHLRLRDDTGGFNQSIVRPGIGYALKGNHALWAGYGWIRSDRVTGGGFDEHRIWQQWTYAPKLDDWHFLHRSRFEQRLVETGDDLGFRWRQLFRAQRILTSNPQWSLVGWDEAFFHLNDTDWGANAGFDQNRVFLGFGFKRSDDARTRLEIGYLNQFVNRRNATDGLNHILSVNLFF